MTEMAFVSLGGSAILGQAVQAKGGPAIAERSVVQPKYVVGMNAMRSFVAPKPYFSSIDTPEKAYVLADSAVETKETLINAAYKQVFGNCYLMESERAELAKAESDFKLCTLSVRELVRSMAKSEAYKKRFFARAGPYRFIELNFKHLMGRGPNSQEEISFHVQKLMNDGYDAEIDSYVDSDEYSTKFGDWIVPRFIFEGKYPKNDGFNRMTIMRNYWDGCSTSSISGSTAPGAAIPARLTMGRGEYCTGFVGFIKGLPAGYRPELEPQATKKLAPVPLNSNAPIRMRIEIAENLFQVFEIPPLMAKDLVPEWKKEILAKSDKKWNGVWY